MRDLELYLSFAQQRAREAGELMRKYYRTNENTISHKADNSVVTVADKAINGLLIEKVRQNFPEHGVLGEEESYEPQREQLWVCDPIDGTVSYTHHIPTSMFALGYVEDGVPLVGVAYNPWTDDMYYAAKGKGAYRNNDSIKVAAGPANADGRNIIGSSRMTDGARGWSKPKKLNFFISKEHGVVFKLCLVAEGSMNGQVFEAPNAHDVAAMACIVKEAGGKVTDLDGNEQRYDRAVNGCVCSDGRIHDELLKLIEQSRPS